MLTMNFLIFTGIYAYDFDIKWLSNLNEMLKVIGMENTV